MSSFPIYYVSYDRFPAPKGAAVHIDAFTQCLAAQYGDVRLITVANPKLGAESQSNWEQPGVHHLPITITGKSLIDRVMRFRRQLIAKWPTKPPEVVHVRSIFEGYPIARDKRARCKRLVYEVNGLPSIELKYHYPQAAEDDELLRKIRHQEKVCLTAADLVITVSHVNANYLCRLGVDERKIRVIPNGFDTKRFAFQPPTKSWEQMRVLYVGTLSSWQGVRSAIEALALYLRDFPARLLIVGDGRRRQRQALAEFADRLGVRDRMDMLPAQEQSELLRYYHQSDVVVAPLQANDRNLLQGCCPLKVIEAMAAGTPLIASDIPVIRSLARSGVDALLVRPGSAKAIKDAMLRLKQEPTLALQLAASARRRVKQHFTWRVAQAALIDAYQELLDGSLRGSHAAEQKTA